MHRQKRNKRTKIEWSYTYLLEHPIVLVHLASAHQEDLEYIREKFKAKLEAPGADIGIGRTLTIRCDSKTDLNEAISEMDDILDDVHLFQKMMVVPKSALRTIQKLRQFSVLLTFSTLCRTWIQIHDNPKRQSEPMTVEIHIAGNIIVLEAWERLLGLLESSLSQSTDGTIGATIDELIIRSQFLLPKNGQALLEDFKQSLLDAPRCNLEFTQGNPLDACINEYRSSLTKIQ